ncbi:MAG TPA: DUF488 family protein [Thermoanaerobaculia bacterium]|nr:DUF488 family protein [Thermoanaerobaculia bacterium]
MRVAIKRVYEPACDTDGRRILVDRLWPRGLSKQEARLDGWARSAAPSDELRRWYHRDPDKFAEFRRRYRRELEERPEALLELRSHLGSGKVTLVFASREEVRNNAAVLRELLQEGTGEGD